MSGKIPDVFSNDAFSAVELTQQINTIPFQALSIQKKLSWGVTNSTTGDVAIEKGSQGIAVIDAAPRGSAGAEFGLTKKTGFKLSIPHYPVGSSISTNELKAALQSIGDTGELVGVQSLHDRYMQNWAKISFPQAWERGAGGALDGIARNSDGSTLLDLGDLYGETPAEVQVDFTNAAFDWITTLEEAKAAAVKNLGGFPAVSDWVLFMFGSAAKAVRSNTALAKTKERIDPAFLSADRIKNSSQYRFSDDVELFSYQSTPNVADPISFDNSGGCMLCPVIEGLYDVTYAPAETIDTENAPGVPLYADVPQEYITKRGYRLTAESNFLFTVKRLKALTKFVQA